MAKVAACYTASFIGSLTIYYFARIWAEGKRKEAMVMRQQLNTKYGIDYLRENKETSSLQRKF